MVTTKTPKVKAVVPPEVTRSMKLWRDGFIDFPQNFIDFHLALATRERKRLEDDFRIVVHSETIVRDGWGDGMRVLQLIVERSDRLAKLHWHEGNQEFFIKHPSGGGTPFDPETFS